MQVSEWLRLCGIFMWQWVKRDKVEWSDVGELWWQFFHTINMMQETKSRSDQIGVELNWTEQTKYQRKLSFHVFFQARRKTKGKNNFFLYLPLEVAPFMRENWITTIPYNIWDTLFLTIHLQECREVFPIDVTYTK